MQQIDREAACGVSSPFTSTLGRLMQEGHYELAAYRLVYGLYLAARKARDSADGRIVFGADPGRMRE